MNELMDLGQLTNYRFQRIDITVPNGAAINNYTATVQLDRQFNSIVRIGFFEVEDGGISPNYNVGAKTDRQVWIDPINFRAWQADQGVGPMFKYYKVNISYGSGDTFYLMLNTLAVTSADLIAQMVLILAKTDVEQPR